MEADTTLLSESDIEILAAMLDRLSDVMSSAGCNDFELEDTPAHRELVLASYRRDEAEYDLRFYNGKIVCDDFVILDELKRRLLSCAGFVIR